VTVIKGKSTTGILIWFISLSVFIANPKAHISLISMLCLVELNNLLRKLKLTSYLPVMLLSIIYIVFAVHLYLKIFASSGLSALILISFIATLSDSFSYIGGTFFKRQQKKVDGGLAKTIYNLLCYKPFTVSPNKTVVGFLFAGVGGLVAVTCLDAISITCKAVLHLAWIGKLLTLPKCFAPWIGFILGVSGQAGDLLESSIKRLCRVKDSGSILAEHGGICDRYDSTYSIIYCTYLVLLLGGCL